MVLQKKKKIIFLYQSMKVFVCVCVCLYSLSFRQFNKNLSGYITFLQNCARKSKKRNFPFPAFPTLKVPLILSLLKSHIQIFSLLEISFSTMLSYMYIYIFLKEKGSRKESRKQQLYFLASHACSYRRSKSRSRRRRQNRKFRRIKVCCL